MVTKADPDLPHFGIYLASIRNRAGIKSQRQAAAMSHRLNKRGSVDITLVTSSQINADEKGLVSNIPIERLKAYSIIYKVSITEIISRLIEEKYGVNCTENLEVSISEIPEIVYPEEREAYKLLRHLLDTRSREDVLTCLRMIAGGS